MQFVPFEEIVGPTYTLSSLNAECQRCVNLMVETIGSGDGASGSYLRETPGLEVFTDLFNKGIFGEDLGALGMHVCGNGRVFLMMYSSVVEILPTGAYVIYGIPNVPSTLTPAQLRSLKYTMSDNTIGMFIVLDPVTSPGVVLQVGTTGQNVGFFRFSDNKLIMWSTTSFIGCLGGTCVDFLDNYFITNVVDTTSLPYKYTGQFQISPIAFDGGVNFSGTSVWDVTKVFTAESSPDALTKLIVNGRELWLFGPYSYEVWYDSGDSSQAAFKRIPGAAYNTGCLSPQTVKILKKSVFWLGNSEEGYGSVYMSRGLQAIKVSNTSVETIFRSYGTLTDAYAYCYELPGHSVYVISFPSANTTFAYDLETGFWHEMSSRDLITNVYGVHRVRYQVFAFGKNLVSDPSRLLVSYLSPTSYREYYKNYGGIDTFCSIRRYRRSPVSSSQRRRIFHHKLELDIETGVGLEDGSDATIYVRWSDDNGHTWGNYHNRSIGKQGDYKKIVVFNRLGSTIKRVYEIYFNDMTPFKLISAELGIDIGVH